MSTTITQAIQKVGEFHEKLGLLQRATLERPAKSPENAVLHDHASTVNRVSRSFLTWLDKPRSLRAHLMCEELSEVLSGLSQGDELLLLDGLADLLYVLLGTAAIFDLPLEAALEEVHRSNMTKEKQPDDEHANRIRKKGPNYSPPDLKRVLRDYRAKQNEERQG